jgi:phage shock protein C
MEKKLRRSLSDAVIGGVCSGLSEWTNIDVTIWRLVFVIGSIFTLFPFPLLYILLWVFIPSE